MNLSGLLIPFSLPFSDIQDEWLCVIICYAQIVLAYSMSFTVTHTLRVVLCESEFWE